MIFRQTSHFTVALIIGSCVLVVFGRVALLQSITLPFIFSFCLYLLLLLLFPLDCLRNFSSPIELLLHVDLRLSRSRQQVVLDISEMCSSELFQSAKNITSIQVQFRISADQCRGRSSTDPWARQSSAFQLK